MDNVRGDDGCINATGVPGGNAKMLKSSLDVDFLSQIEDGIKDTVILLLEYGFSTFSSCQGHSYGSKYCFVSIIDDYEQIINYKNSFENYLNNNIKYMIKPIILELSKYDDEMDIYNRMKKNLTILKFIFGSSDDIMLKYKKSIFHAWVRNRNYLKYNK